MDAKESPGMLTTVPMTFTGNHLELNASTRVGDSVIVELLDSDGKPVATSKPFTGDSLRHVAGWEKAINLA